MNIKDTKFGIYIFNKINNIYNSKNKFFEGNPYKITNLVKQDPPKNVFVSNYVWLLGEIFKKNLL